VGILYWLPPINRRLSWRVDLAESYLRGVIDPVEELPTSLPQPRVVVNSRPTETPLPPAVLSPTAGPSPTPTLSPTPLPEKVSLTAPAWEKQDINNCGPATLAMNLRYYGWEGDQMEIAELLKPVRQDRNVNVEELIYYVRTRAGWLNAEFRVGGDLELLKQLLAAGIPVMIEESFHFEETYWPNDDQWAAHYNLLTGYDEAAQTFISQDSFYGANQIVSYTKTNEYWKSFNYVYIMFYLPDQEETVRSILGENWDVDINRQNALDKALEQTREDSEDAYAWFNMGTNLVFFGRYAEAAQAYDQARALGLPQRMLRYQFGPFFAYFNTGRSDDLQAMIDYALARTPNAEEALLWRGWANYQKGDVREAEASFRQALEENPNYQDAKLALDILRND
ncbi:MAG TPA: C39 family peptidase, partial [Anaerolineales bacterium]|nr:C39 family peptidase [Anaerolineales bacterium]